MTGLFTFRGRVADLALRRLREPEPSELETRLLLALGSERLGENLTRAEAAEIVRRRAVDALLALLERGGCYPCSIVVCSSTSVAIDPHDGAVTQLIAREDTGGGMSVEILIGETAAAPLLALRRRATDGES